MAKKEVTKKEEAQVEDTSFLDEDSGEGYEGVNAKLPMVKVLHLTAEEVTSGLAKAGEWFNTATKKVYGKALDLIVLKAQSVWTIWVPENRGGGFKGKVPVGSIPVTGDFYDKDNKPVDRDGNEIVEQLELYCLDPEDLAAGPFLLALKGDSIKHGNNLMNAIRTHVLPRTGNVPPVWGSVWRLTTEINKKNIGGKPTSWYTFGQGKSTNVEFVRWITKDEADATVKPSLDFVKIAATLGAPRAAQGAIPETTSEDALY